MRLLRKAMFSTFLLTGMREQEVMYLYWTDLNLRLRTVRVTAKPDRVFYPKRWEEREVPIPSELVHLLQDHPRTNSSSFVFPSPRGNREQNMLLRCKDVAERAGITTEFDLKTFRSTYATRMLGSGFDVRTVQHWMGHKSLETTMRYLVPATDVHERLDKVKIPNAGSTPRKPASAESARRGASSTKLAARK
jgi:integrase/recombinase XerD